MARPERNNVDYFPFYCEDGKKMFYIEETYGNDGFATFVKILRELAKTEYHYLDLSKNTTLMFLSAKCKIDRILLEKIITDLVDLGKFNKLLWDENKIIWCQDFVDSIQDAYKKRNNKCITFEGLVNLLIGLGIRKQGKDTSKAPVNPQRKEKEIKEEKSIVEKDKKPINNGKDVSDIINSFSNEEISDLKEMTLFSGTESEFNEMKVKFSVEFISRYGIGKTEIEVKEIFKSWMYQNKNMKHYPKQKEIIPKEYCKTATQLTAEIIAEKRAKELLKSETK